MNVTNRILLFPAKCLLLVVFVYCSIPFGLAAKAELVNGAGQQVSGAAAPDSSNIPEGQTLETRARVNPNQTVAFVEQTRAKAIKTKTPYTVAIFATGLKKPWGIDFLPDGRMIVSEKVGSLRIVGKDGNLGEPLEGVPQVYFHGDAGLLDVKVDPSFSKTRLIYFTYVEPRSDGTGLLLACAQLSDNDRTIVNLKQLLRVDSSSVDASYGGRLLFLQDGTLLITTGDRMEDHTRIKAQDLDSLYGKVLRINKDGISPQDNPYAQVSGSDPRVWTFGHRNSQGLALNAETGEVWECEHGPQGGDEINLLKSGSNYGWPVIAYGTEYDGKLVNGGKSEKSGLDQPVYFWDPSIAPSGLTYYSGSELPEWKGNLFIASLAGEHLSRLVLDHGKVIAEERLLQNKHVRVRYVAQGPHGDLWVLTDSMNGNILRISRAK